MGTSWLFKHFPAADSRIFETAPRLVREPVPFQPRPGQLFGDLDLKLVSSVTDPLGDIQVREAQYIPRSMFADDSIARVLDSNPPARSPLEKVRRRRRLRRY